MDTLGLSHLMAILGSGSGCMPMEFWSAVKLGSTKSLRDWRHSSRRDTKSWFLNFNGLVMEPGSEALSDMSQQELSQLGEDFPVKLKVMSKSKVCRTFKYPTLSLESAQIYAGLIQKYGSRAKVPKAHRVIQCLHAHAVTTYITYNVSIRC